MCQEIALLLSLGKFEEIEQLTRGRQLSAADMSHAVSEYGVTLLSLPDEGIELIRVYELTEAQDPGWSVDIPLWSEQEGRSDLTLSLTLVDRGQDELTIEIDDLHVL